MITDSSLQFFFTNLNTMLGEAYTTTPIVHDKFASVIPVTSEDWKAGWTGRMDKMRVWAGPRVTEEPAPQTYTVSMIPFEQTRKIDRFRLDDDTMGLYYRMLPDMAVQAKRLPDFQIRDLLQNLNAYVGIRQNGLDGLTHFNTAHPVDLFDAGKGTYCNDFTGGGVSIGGVTVGGAMSPTAVSTLWTYMSGYKAEDGEPLGIEPNMILAPSTMKLEVDLILKSTFFAPPSWGTVTGQVGAADNPLQRFGMEPLYWPLLNNAQGTNWYMLDTNHAMKPFTWLQRTAPVFQYLIDENSAPVFNEHSYVYGAWARGSAAWSFAWLSARSGP